jgi:hypothetical protein
MPRAIIRGYNLERVLDYPESSPELLGVWLQRTFDEFKIIRAGVIPFEFTVEIR